MTSDELDARLTEFLRKRGDWFWGDTPTEQQWTYREAGLLFYMCEDIGRHCVWVQTEPLDTSVVYFSTSMPDQAIKWPEITDIVLPLVDRLMVLDDLASLCR